MAECPIEHCHQLSYHKPFKFWGEKEPPMGCAEDDEALHGKTRRITHYSQCPMLMREAANQAKKRKAAPHCYDQNGNLIPGMAGEMWGCLVRYEREGRAHG